MDNHRARNLVLLRHAKSAWPDGIPDHDRPLNGRGRRDAPAAGRWLRRTGCVPDYVVCSTARRAQETWQLAQGELGARPPTALEPAVYEASAAELLDLVRRAPPEARRVMVVGHDPALPELARALARGNAGHDRPRAEQAHGIPLDRLLAKFPTGAIAVLAYNGEWPALDPGRVRLASFVTPHELG